MAIEKLPVKKLVEFRRLSKPRKVTFTNKLKVGRKPASAGDGGNYWVRSLSAISKAFKENDNSIIIDKIEEVSDLYNLNQRSQTKRMYKRNIDILSKYKDFDFTQLRPTADLKFLSKPNSILEMGGLPVQILPQHIFSYGAENNQSIGGIWFIVWQDGFKPSDLGIYSETLFRYLSSYYSKDYIINPAACIIVDVTSLESISYKDVLNGEIPSILDDTMKSVKEYL
ncbi:hypothetical protein BFP77_15665 [Maribacter sp. 4U21]|uniref:hypothetical protein n=1 Tax=Maribacter sp. 4U21 TaxID=1889779 RepID=UPI000C14C8EC|nr:hypothetical protein [Maribacter sp. 4U21]PIB23747.1 hypothetical protein BFP77_15665 [Maribacter sp. 4U21]